MPLSKSDIAKEYQPFMYVQDYSKKSVIEGVQVVEIKVFTGEDGDFSELARFTQDGKLEAFPEFTVRQMSRSKVMPKAVKAWHFHLKQDEIQTVLPEDKLTIGLWDLRENSKTKGQTMRLSFGGGKSHWVFIPKGVAHGYMNPFEHPATVIYMTSEQFNMEDPDEMRMPWDSMGKEFWELPKE
ncbi:MAG TPA: dTDP-4-dehydrorhamnose 3,5-epimerase family protein [Candidatus Eisenbacteria bacterium]|nr:dTDP-4-dehydrorhamnose 3,5-epimerase family protein [Candidatus Eisenbacteria bacterium]